MSYQKYNLQPNFKPVDHIYEARLRQFIDTGGQYAKLNLPKFYDFDRLDIPDLAVWKVPDGPNGETKRPLFKEIDFDSLEWKPARKGDSFGPSWKTFWFKLAVKIPPKWIEAKQAVELHWDCNNEGLIYSEDGMPLQAFSGGNERTIFSFPKQYLTDKAQTFYLETACNGMFGNGDNGVPDPNRHFGLSKADLVLPNLEARQLFWDFWILSDAARELPNGWQKYQSADICNKIMNAFDPDDVKSITECRRLAKSLLGDNVDSDIVYQEFGTLNNTVDVYAIGNCHIDTAWLWPFAETKRKIVRSWTTQLKIADEYPEYVFVASQMQQFKWLKLYHPEIFEKVKEKYTTNQFLPIGGSWVENDTNIPNGESLIRQFLLGQRFQLNEFGAPATVFWLPDTFGYSSQVPQICHLAGIEKFLTQKLSWNNINQFPLSTFNWSGIDGSQILVHMPPANTYTAGANFGDVVRSQHQHKNLRDVPIGMLLYGKGDGGGGPTEEMLEKLRRSRGLANNTNAIPIVHSGKTVEDFYDEVLERSDNGSSLPTWKGEIYLEFHRGTYTTQADVKKWVRLLEIKVHDLEWIATLISLHVTKYKYPSKDIHDVWEDLCLCQFHDVIPGSCIGMVYYEEVKPMLTKNLKKVDRLIEAALDHLPSDDKKAPKFVNTLPWERNEIMEVPSTSKLFSKIGTKNSVTTDSGSRLISVSAEGINELAKIKYPASVTQENDYYVLTNELIEAKITQNGVITSLFDIVNKREIIDTTKTKQTGDGSVIGGNQLIVFDDEPLTYPAWDTELYSLEKFKFLNNGQVTRVVNSALKSSLFVKHKISEESYIETEISIEGLVTKGSSNNFIKFKSNVEWHETYKFLKVQFPTTVYTAAEASYETQFGVTKRATHYNTTWDIAKFEVCHHKFMDLSEYNYGVSVINNAKYGASIHGNLMRLSLLRSPKAPDNLADMGHHEFEYALYPHKGPLNSDVVKLAYNFNYKLDKFYLDDRLLLNSVSIDSESIILSHIKRSEDDEDVSVDKNIPIKNKGQKSFVVRVYECLGGSSSALLKFDKKLFSIDKVFKTNGLEEEIEEVKATKNAIRINLRGFEIGSYKVVLK